MGRQIKCDAEGCSETREVGEWEQNPAGWSSITTMVTLSDMEKAAVVKATEAAMVTEFGAPALPVGDEMTIPMTYDICPKHELPKMDKSIMEKMLKKIEGVGMPGRIRALRGPRMAPHLKGIPEL